MSYNKSDRGVLLTECEEEFISICKGGFQAALLYRPDDEKEEISEIVRDITDEYPPEEIDGHAIMVAMLAFENLGALEPLADYLDQMSEIFHQITGIDTYVLEPRIDMPRRLHISDPKGTGHEHDFTVLNTVFNGQRGTGWITDDGQEVSAECGDWLYMPPHFLHFATTTNSDEGRMTFAFH